MCIKKSRGRTYFFSKMVVRLWIIMMGLVLLIIGLMWSIQIFVMEYNYTHMALKETQDQLAPIMDELPETDLAENPEMLSYLSRSANGKTLLVDKNGTLIGVYAYGYAIGLEKNDAGNQVWKEVQKSKAYDAILEQKPYTNEKRNGSKLVAYEIGLPTLYHGEAAYVFLYQSFTELYAVLDMNRKQLVLFSILLTVISAGAAAFLAQKFVKPIHVIKDTVDQLSGGNWTAMPGLALQDEVGQLANSVEQLGKSLQRVETLRKEVIANVSHELRSPLALIGGYAEMARDVHWNMDREREEDLNLIISETYRMSEMVSDILDYSQLQSGYLQLHKDHYDLAEIIESELLLCEQSAGKYQIHIRAILSQERYPVFVDALKISQVIRNLMFNAINHTKEGREVVVEIEEKNSEYTVKVRNPGVPIPDEERKLIWERYQRSQHQGGRNEGTGLGLSIVSTILKAHEMSYGVKREEEWNIFWFRCRKDQQQEIG